MMKNLQQILLSQLYIQIEKKNNTLQHSQRPIPDHNIKLKGSTLKITQEKEFINLRETDFSSRPERIITKEEFVIWTILKF